MFRDAFESFSSSLSERLVNPFTGSFLLSWPFWNYKLVLIVFSDSKVQVKISLISTVAYGDWYAAVFLGVVAPAFTALAYIYVYPLPSRWFVRHSLQQKKKLHALRQQIDEETLLTKEESDKLRRKYNIGAKALEEELEEKNALIRDMRQQAEKASEGDVESQRKNRQLMSELEIVKAKYADATREIASVGNERDNAMRAKQELMMEVSSNSGKIAGMSREVDSLRMAYEQAQEQLRTINSEFTAQKYLVEGLSVQKNEALERAATASRSNDELIHALDEFLSFFSSPEVLERLPYDLRASVAKLSSNATKAML